jgi:hypothetical protein
LEVKDLKSYKRDAGYKTTTAVARMSSIVREYFHVIKTLAEIDNPFIRRDIIEYFYHKHGFRKAMNEISLNTIHGNIPLDSKQRAALKEFRQQIEDLGYKRDQRLGAYVQTGGALPIISPSLEKVLCQKRT